MRLDKYLAHAGLGTRSEVKKIIRSGRVLLDGVAVRKPEEQVPAGGEVLVDGRRVCCLGHVYIMLNKPKGVVSAVSDPAEKTVVDLVRESEAACRGEGGGLCGEGLPANMKLFPVGRLDKDTEGLLLLTDDGALAHELLSPGKHVGKTYQVWADGVVSDEDRESLSRGVDIGDEKPTRPAVLADIRYFDSEGNVVGELRESGETVWGSAAGRGNACQTRLQITITEGRYHQVKRMFAAVGKPVRYLKRISMGALRLDGGLAPGEYRLLTEGEMDSLRRLRGTP